MAGDQRMRAFAGHVLTKHQLLCVWLAGSSHPERPLLQGGGKRSAELHYGNAGNALVVYGYASPLLKLHLQGFMRRDEAGGYKLTELGKELWLELFAKRATFDPDKHLKRIR